MKKLNSKQKLMGGISIILIAVIIAIVITTSIIRNNNQIANEGYSVATANADSEIIANYIKKGITIGGVTGKLESLNTFDATATAEDIVAGKVAYARGERIVGTMGAALETESYVGNYADINDDGTVDGIIFADLAIGGSGEWGTNGWGIYEIPKENNFKTYCIKNENYTDSHLGSGKVIAPMEENEESKNERFYVMSLDDFRTEDYTTFYWYNSAIGLDNQVSYSANDFGDGKTNTTTMISKWNSTAYGAQNAVDMWRVIQDEVSEGWFVPSKSEWAAFGAAFEITSSNFSTFGLGYNYWASSQHGTSSAYRANFYYGRIYGNTVSERFNVRLATTF